MTEFLKMHGLGNDFIIFDWRRGGVETVSAVAARALADGRRGIGCDQILVIRRRQGRYPHGYPEP